MFNEFYAWVIQIFPWLSDVIPVLKIVQAVWNNIESVVLLIGLFWVGRRLKRERIKISGLIDDLGEKVDTSGQIANAAREAAETAMSRPWVRCKCKMVVLRTGNSFDQIGRRRATVLSLQSSAFAIKRPGPNTETSIATPMRT